MQTKSEPPDGSPTAAIRDVQFLVLKGAARRPDAAPRIPRREVNLNFERDGLLGGDGGLFAKKFINVSFKCLNDMIIALINYNMFIKLYQLVPEKRCINCTCGNFPFAFFAYQKHLTCYNI